MEAAKLQRSSRAPGALRLLPIALLVAMLISVLTLADGPIASSSFVGVENPLSENGAWLPIMAYSPYGTLFQKNNGAFADRLSPLNHAVSRTTAVIPINHYSEIVVGHIGTTANNVGPLLAFRSLDPVQTVAISGGPALLAEATSFIAWTLMSPTSPAEPATPPPTSFQPPQSLTVTDSASSYAAKSSTDSKTACATSSITPAPTPPNTPPARLESWPMPMVR